MTSTITTHFKGKLSSKAYLFSIKFLNFNTDQEISLGTLIVNSQSGQASIRLIPQKDIYLNKNFNLDELAKECLDYVRQLEKTCIIF